MAYRLAEARFTAARRTRVGREADLARLGRDLVDVVPGLSFDVIEADRKLATWVRWIRFVATDPVITAQAQLRWLVLGRRDRPPDTPPAPMIGTDARVRELNLCRHYFDLVAADAKTIEVGEWPAHSLRVPSRRR
ncbi:hypothetical protein OG243_44390 [Streptomyces sp. NBC_01318]|uniref:hypothetical protein n=1 Tax=unclassified Streptomyces TaxID=2593676 RepID=UPI002E123684|nr:MULTISPECIES: hypothetical protein [unclassified Streptomyces]WSJ48217.1 hypothetical protein OG243_00155 [Streptomyces sp. NBC_01318]WSJ55923.1 hypothetical protein OG243_44390 [Streptomyces sp. NBC_01318]